MNISLFTGIVLMYLFLVFVLTMNGSKRKVGRLRIFLVSLLLTPLTGLLVYRLSDPVYVLQLTRYHCPRCGIDFTESISDCPYCRRDGKYSRLHPMVMRCV
jgi:hypothetical protein